MKSKPCTSVVKVKRNFDYEPVLNALMVGTRGKVRLTAQSGRVVTLSLGNPRQLLPIFVRCIHSQGTTARNIYGIYENYGPAERR